MRHIILKEKIKPVTPVITKYLGNILNISSWVYHEQQKGVDEMTKHLKHIFDNHDWDTKDDYVATIKTYRNKKMYWNDKEVDEHKDTIVEVDDDEINKQKHVIFKFKFEQ